MFDVLNASSALRGLTLGLVSCLLASSSFAEKKNIILIMADDSAVDNYSAYNSDFFSSPRIDSLASSGTKFNYCYSEPVCTSSRVKLMTGRDGIRNYLNFGTLDKSETTFGTMLKKAGYATAVAGKWQLQGEPNGSLPGDCDFDTYCLWNIPGATGDRYWNPTLLQDGKLLETTEKDYGPDIVSDFLIDFIEENQDRPFFAYYPMILVHNPFPETPDSKPISKEEAAKYPKGLKHYRDMISYADKTVGRIVDTLDRLGIRENTVIIFTADNGTNRSLTYPFHGEQRVGEKAYATEGGSHVPLVINCPGTIPEGIVTDDIVDFSDMLPTLAEISGAKLPEVTLDGRSFWPQCLGEEGNPREWIFQYYYPKFVPAAEKHGQGVGKREIVWAQNQHYKLYRDGAYFAVSDRYEANLIEAGRGTASAERTRKLLQKAIDSMPKKAALLDPKYGQ